MDIIGLLTTKGWLALIAAAFIINGVFLWRIWNFLSRIVNVLSHIKTAMNKMAGIPEQ